MVARTPSASFEGRNMSTYDLVQEDVADVFERWADRDAPYFETSRLLFEYLVMPAAEYLESPPESLLEQTSLAYTEWLLFEYPIDGLHTPIELYAMMPSGMVSEGRAGRIEQVARTQRFSQFALGEKNPREGTVRVRDVNTGDELELCCPDAATRHRWKMGLLGARIALVNGSWVCVGGVKFYDRAPDADPSLRDRPTDIDCVTGSFYLDLLRETIGIDGAYFDSLNLVRLG